MGVAVSAAPLEDTAEVKAAKAEFQAAFDAAAAGKHIELAPVNNDVQSEQIASSYLADTEDVAAAKAEFQATFDDAAAGGLAAKQAPAPVHAVAAPFVHHALPLNYAAYHYAGYPYVHHLGAYSYGLPYTFPLLTPVSQEMAQEAE